MSPLALIPVGVYVILATLFAETAIEKSISTKDHGTDYPKISENLVRLKINTNSDRLSDELSRLTRTGRQLENSVVRAVLNRGLKYEVTKTRKELEISHPTSPTKTSTEHNKPVVEQNTENNGYSAPLSFTDSSHNDWMK